MTTFASHESYRRNLGPHPAHEQPDSFPVRFAQKVTSGFGSITFIMVQTLIIIAWIIINAIGVKLRWDPYPFILLNLMFSVQAAYAAPLILLAQNRQEDRDRQALENDRAVAARTQENAEYLARELAGVRLALSNTATSGEVREAIDALNERLDQLIERSTPDERRGASQN